MTKEQMIILNGVVSFVLTVFIGFIIGVMI